MAGTKEGKVAWIKADGTMEGEVADLGSWVSQLQMAPDGSRAVAGTDEGQVAWIKADGTMAGEVADLGSPVTQLQMAPDGGSPSPTRWRCHSRLRLGTCRR